VSYVLKLFAFAQVRAAAVADLRRREEGANILPGS
jgi:hypothetical protein